MNWLFWAQHRRQFLIVGVILLAFAGLVVPTGLHFWHTYQHALTACQQTDTCADLPSSLFTSQIDRNLFALMKVAMLALPVLLGLFWGAPLLAREYEEGTNKLVWTQSVSRRKWLTVKLAGMLLVAAMFAGAFTALATWWSQTTNTLHLDRFNSVEFASQGITPVAYTIFAVALGAAFGAWFKRTLVALGATLAVLIVVLNVVPTVLRPHYVAPVTYTAPTNDFGPKAQEGPANAGATWVTRTLFVNSKGDVLDFKNPPKQCTISQSELEERRNSKANGKGTPLGSVDGGPIVDMACIQSLGYRNTVKYQPSYRYWNFQRIEAGLYLGLTLIPLAATYWLVLKRDA